MTQAIVISVDAMGGDHGPSVVAPGAAMALRELPAGVRLLLHGDEDALRHELARRPELASRSELRASERVISMDEKPAQAMRRGKGTSMWNAVETVKTGEATAAVSAGNTGALMAISKLILRMSADLDRPPLVVGVPTPKGVTTFLDVGANVDCDAERLVEFAIMGEAFHRASYGIARPTIGLLNVGSEDMKGHQELRDAHAVLREGRFDLNYHGFVEGGDLTAGVVDVIVTDGFTGNVALKAMEGAAQFMRNELRAALSGRWTTTLGALMARKGLMAFKERVSPPPAAPLLGLNGIVVKCHGGATERDFAQSIQVAAALAQSDFAAEIERNMRKLPAAMADSAPPSVDGAAE